MPSYKQLQQNVLNFRDERDWKKYHSPKNVVISLWVEVGELAEHFQYVSDEELGEHLQNHKNAVADELVDVLWWLLLISYDFGLDLGAEFIRKMRKNFKANKEKGYTPVMLTVPDKVESLSLMQKIITKFREQRGWGQNIAPRDLLLKMFEEMGELAEHVQWKTGDKLLEHINDHQKEIADEIIDVLICTLLLFKHLDYDIALEFQRKLEKNTEKYLVE